ncbi:hypothetical protein EV360DRAFT_86825 [Lentinula raphanica]|nr:hypothetical protein EV360DRAFT_86825 [Lentinula raphanica]
MSQLCLDPKSGLLSLMKTLLTNSPLFVTSIAWKTGSTVTDPNVIAFRSVFKALPVSEFDENSNSPLFVTSIAWKTGSNVTDPNAIAFPCVFKGLLMSLVELVPVEAGPDFSRRMEARSASSHPLLVG